MSLKSRLDGHFLALGALVAAGAMTGLAQQAEASIVYSGVVNIPTAATTNGLYINVVTGQINEPGNTGGSTVPGWDVNIYAGTQLWWSGGQLNWGAIATVANGGTIAQIPAGTVIDGTSINSTTTMSGASQFPTTGPGGYFGFRFFNEVLSQVEYGWGRYYQPAAGGAGVLTEYAYENSGAGIQAGAVPTPGSAALLALGALGLAGRRRR